ncbi:hypothetical protein Tco_1361994 [Tanacetum coccineum]
MIRLRAESPSTSHPLPPPPPIVLSHTRASMAMMRVAAQSTYILAPRSETSPLGTPPHLPIPLPTSSPHLLLPSIDCRADVPEVTLPPRNRLCITPGPRFEVGECSPSPTARPTGGLTADYGFVGTLDAEIRRDTKREIGYGITDTWDEMVKDMQGTPAATDVAGLSQRMTDFVTTVRQDTYEIYGRLDDAQDDRSLMSVSSTCCVEIDAPMLVLLDLWRLSTTDRDWGFAGSRPQEIDTSYRGADSAEDTADSDGSIIESADIC